MMKKNTKQAFTRWINGAGPESAHSYDKERFFNAIYESLKEGENIDSDELATIIRENLKWNENTIQDFSEKTVITIEKIVGFIDFLKNEKRINLYNLL